MNVSLTPHLDRYVEEKLKSGSYSNASEVIREALRLMKKRESQVSAEPKDELIPSERAGVRRRVAQGVADMEQGRYQVYDDKGLQGLARELVANSVRKLASRKRTGRK